MSNSFISAFGSNGGGGGGAGTQGVQGIQGIQGIQGLQGVGSVGYYFQAFTTATLSPTIPSVFDKIPLTTNSGNGFSLSAGAIVVNSYAGAYRVTGRISVANTSGSNGDAGIALVLNGNIVASSEVLSNLFTPSTNNYVEVSFDIILDLAINDTLEIGWQSLGANQVIIAPNVGGGGGG